MNSGLIFDIKRYAINDGPGIRLTIFFKGCPLSCKWCHNPESISRSVQKMYAENKCIGCQSCVTACPENACQLTEKGIVTDLEICKSCGKCADVCPTGATEMSGKVQSVSEVIKEIDSQTIFFDQSGGGVTFSGGEPLMYPDFLHELLDECGKREIHRTVDTSGFAKPETLLAIAQKTDHFLYDLKLMDSDRHKKYTGVANEKILENLKILADTNASINIRIPLIGGINDDEDNIRQSAEFISQLHGEKKQVNLLPFHNIAENKYKKLGENYDTAEMSEPDPERQMHFVTIFAEYGLTAIIGG